MEQRLLLEGDDIDELLERVRVEHGPDARIVHAEQKLVGGVAGFFARRRYEVAVAVGVDAPAPAAPAAPEAPTPTPALAPSSAPVAAPTSAAPALRPSTPPVRAQEVPRMTTFDTTGQSGRPAPTTLDELLALADEHDGANRPAGRPLSTETSSFDHLVRDLVARAEPESRLQPVPFVPPQGPAFEASVPRVLSPVATLHADGDHVPHVDLPGLGLPELDPAEFGIRAADLYPPARFPSGTARFDQDTTPATPAVASTAADQPPAHPRGDWPPAPPRADWPEAPAAPVAAPAAPSMTERQYIAKHSGRPVVVSQSVADLGLPVRELQPEHPADPRVALLDVLSDLAVAVPRRLRGVQVVVGDGTAARRLAASWAAVCGEDGDVVLDSAAEGSETQDELAARIREALARHGGVLVVLDAGTTRAQARRAARRFAALDADDVTAVVDARWDPATTREWLAALGAQGRGVDHVAAHGVDESPTPLRLLELGIQVTWLDDQPATIGAWAAPCLDRWR